MMLNQQKNSGIPYPAPCRGLTIRRRWRGGTGAGWAG